MDAVKLTEGNDVYDQLFRYAIIVQVKCLLLNTTHYILKKDSAKVADGFEKFNCIHDKLLDGYQKVFGSKFNPGKIPSLADNERYLKPKELFQEFLFRALFQGKLTELQQLFKKKDITIGLLMTFSGDDLHDAFPSHFQVIKHFQGNRLKILQTACKLRKNGKLIRLV